VGLWSTGKMPLALSRKGDSPSGMLRDAATDEIRSQRVYALALLESNRPNPDSA